MNLITLLRRCDFTWNAFGVLLLLIMLMFGAFYRMVLHSQINDLKDRVEQLEKGTE
jgi:type VI protein secretion system component VasF